MSKIFYDHLVAREEIIAVLDQHKLTIEEREELVRLVDENLHHQVLDTILTHLPKEKHEEFLRELHRRPHDLRLLDYIQTHIEIDIIAAIKKTSEKAKKELLAEINRSKKK